MSYFQREESAQPQVLGYTTVAEVSQAERMAFYQRVYSLFFLGFAVLTAFAFVGMHLVKTGALPIQFFYGGALILFVLSWFSNQAITNKKAGLFLMFLYASVAGLVLAPLLIIAIVVAVGKGMHPYAIIGQAFGLTTMAFGGLTAYVFISKQDFSYLGGFIAMGFFVVLGFIILSLLNIIQITGVLDLGITCFMIALLCLTVLYDTSNIVHRFGPEHTVFAAFELLMSFFLMLWYILRLLIMLSSDR